MAIVTLYHNRYFFALEADIGWIMVWITLKSDQETGRALLHTAKNNRIGGCFALVFRGFLPKWFSNHKRRPIVMPFFCLIEVHEVGDQFILNIGIIFFGNISAWDILWHFDGKRERILSNLNPTLKPLQHFLLNVKILVSGELAPVLRWSLKPLTVLFPYINHFHTFNADVQSIELKVVEGIDKDSPVDGGAGVVKFVLGVDIDAHFGAWWISITHFKQIFIWGEINRRLMHHHIGMLFFIDFNIFLNFYYPNSAFLRKSCYRSYFAE